MTESDQPSDPDLERAVDLVEEAIRGLGIDPAQSRSARSGPAAYALRRGSARILVAVHPPSGERREGRLRVVAPVIRLPPPEAERDLFRRLLELNAAELVGVAFAVTGDEVIVVAERSVRDLDASEVDRTIRDVGRVADRYDDELATRYGATRSSDA